MLAGNVPLTLRDNKALKRYKKQLRSLTSKKVSKPRKKEIVQNGGFLGALLGPIVSVLGGLLAR